LPRCGRDHEEQLSLFALVEGSSIASIRLGIEYGKRLPSAAGSVLVSKAAGEERKGAFDED
jgi:hypothetical protein